MRPFPQCTGHTLTGTLLFLMVVTAIWLGTLRQMVSGLCLDRAFQNRTALAEGSMRAAAWGLALLETGLPPLEDVSYLVSLDEDSSEYYVVTFQCSETLCYTVSARPATEDDMTLEEIPTTFSADTSG